jgi:hypothetical protein
LRLLLLAILLVLMVGCTPTTAPPSGVWRPLAVRPGDSLNPDLLLLADGRVLVLGGSPTLSRFSVAGTAQIYDPTRNVWSDAAPIPEARLDPTVTLLKTGNVLVAGGVDVHEAPLRSAYLFDPKQNSWARVADMNVARSAASAVSLDDGRVLVVGGAAGWTGSGGAAPASIADAEVFDPSTASWSTVHPVPSGGVIQPSLLLLRDGGVLAAGGSSQNSSVGQAAIFNPADSTWFKVENLPQPRTYAALEVTPSGQVVMMGGEAFAGDPNGGGFAVNPALDAELFDLGSGTWTIGSPPTSTAANSFVALFDAVAPLHDGRMLLLGPAQGSFLAFTYDPAADFWQVAGSPPPFQGDPRVLTLRDGRVFALAAQSAWVYDPAQTAQQAPSPTSWLDSPITTLLLLCIGAVVALAIFLRRLSVNRTALLCRMSDRNAFMRLGIYGKAAPCPRRALEQELADEVSFSAESLALARRRLARAREAPPGLLRRSAATRSFQA